MQNLLNISLSKNQLKISTAGKSGFEGRITEIPQEIARDSKILNTEEFAKLVKTVLHEFKTPSVQKKELVFLVEPAEVFLRFVVLDKNTEDIDLTIVESAREKLSGVGVSLEDLYFSYQKIAPFVYQFVAIRKEDLDIYLQVSNLLGMSLKAVVPWVLLLPKFLTTNDPCVFIIKNQIRNVIALAELNGIYYCEDFGGEKSLEDIQQLVQQLSVYKRSEPIHKVYTISETNLDLDNSFEVNPLLGLIGENKEAVGFETHLLTIYLLTENPDYLMTQVNLLNLLPVPVVQEKKSALIYVGGALVLLMLLGGAFWLVRGRQSLHEGNLASNTDDSPVVLSNQDAGEVPEPNTVPEVEEPAEELNKEDLSIRVENGAGIQGVAAQAQTHLEEKGYVVQSIGNAEETGRQDTLVRFKPSSLKFKDLLVADMEEEYNVTVEETLEQSAEYDVLVIIGTN